MTDRELLEKAAKAAGLYALFEMYGWDEIGDGAFMDANEPPTLWNPLTDDGDALRLAVTLGLTINPYQEGVFVSRFDGEEVVAEPFEVMGKPDAPATRRAIVRSAAALGDA